MNLLDADHIYKTYNESFVDRLNHEKKIHVIKDLSIKVESGDCIGIMGKSGCGKTTLLKMLGTIDRPTRGAIRFNGENVEKMNDTEIALLRRKNIGYVFQDYNLFNHLTVEENIMVPLVVDKRKHSEIKEKVYKNAEYMNITSILKKYPYEISGGEKQRTAIARALVNDPQIILGDEPTGNLDASSAKSIMNYLVDINRTKGKTMIIVTHDAFVASFCKKVLFIKEGRIEKVLDNVEDKKENSKNIIEIMMKL